MAEDIRLSVGADTTQMESQIANAARKATVVIRPTIDSKGLEKISAPLGRITGQADEFSKSMEAANARVLAFGASVGVLNAVAKSFQNIVTASTQVEASLKEIQVATGETSGNLEKLGKGIFEVARSTGLSFKQASEATLEFARQGGTLEDSLMKAKAALVLTRTTGLDAAEAVKGLTAAVLSFNQVGLDYETVVNKLAAVDTKFAVSSRDLIEGISRSASVAQEAGVSFDELTALITTLQEKTARGGAVIGNALKTIFQRVQTTENLDYIRNLGIAVNDVSGDILPATTIIKKLADEFQNLDSATRKGLLIKIGGGFQIDKLAALLNDISNANGTFNRSLEQSSNAGNQGFKKLDELNKTVQASFDRLTTSGTQFAATIGKVAFSDDFRSILNKTSSFLESLNESISGGEEGGATIGKAIIKGVGAVITGPGALLIAGLGIKLFGDLAKFGVDSLKNQLGVTNVKKEQQDIEKSILGLLLQNTAVQSKIVSLEGNKTAQAEYLLGLYSKQAATLEKMSKLSKDIGPSVYQGGIRLTEEGTKNVKSKTAAGGYMSKDAARKMEMQEAPAGASIREISNFNFGPTEGRGTMIVNSMESVHKTPMGDFVIPSYSKTRTGKPTLFSASGYVPNFAEEKQKENLLKNLNIDGGAYSFAGLTIGGTGSKAVRAKEVTPQVLSQIKDPVLSEALSKYSKLNFSNVNVGNIYRRRDENLDSLEASEQDIKNHFVKKANDALSPQIGTFIKDELSSLGIKPTATMQLMMNRGKKFDLVNDSMAGTFFETMLKMANMSAEDENFGQFFNDSNSRFDIYGLKPDIAEQYGLPKKFWEYVEIKSSEKALNDELGTKFIQQLSQSGGESLKSKFLAQAKTGAGGYVPNFAKEKISALKKGGKGGGNLGFYYDDGAKESDDYLESGNVTIKRKKNNKNAIAYRSDAKELINDARKIGSYSNIKNTYGSYLSPKFEYDKILDPNTKESSLGGLISNLQGAIAEKEFKDQFAAYVKVEDFNAGIDFHDSNKKRLVEIKARRAALGQKEANNKVLAFLGSEEKGQRKNNQSENLDSLLKDIDFTVYESNYDLKTAAKGYVPNFAGTTNFEGSASRYGYKIGQVYNKGEEAIKATFNNPTTAFSGTVTGKESYGRKYGVTVDEKGIIASILGNNTFVAGKDQRRVLESLATRLSSQGAMVKGSGFNIAGLQGGRLATNPDQVITANIKGKFKKIDYEKLDKIFPRFWKSKGLGDVWEKTKLAATYKASPTSYSEIIKDRPDLQETLSSSSLLRQNNTLLRDAAVEAVLKRDPSVAGFLVDIANSGDEAFLKQQGYGGAGIKYAMPFSGKPFSDIENKAVKEEEYKLRKEYQQKGVFYGDFLAEKEKYLKFGKNWKYASGRKFLQPDGAKTAAKGYVPNFASGDVDGDGIVTRNDPFIKKLMDSAKKFSPVGKELANNIIGNLLNLPEGIDVFEIIEKLKFAMKAQEPFSELNRIKEQAEFARKYPKKAARIKEYLEAEEARKRNRTAAKGYIPNFSREAILDAIGREQNESGLPLSAIKVVQDSRVRGPRNPNGYAVINNRDEPDGRVPNFAVPSGDLDPTAAIEESLKGLKNSSLSLNDAFKRIAENLNVSGEKVAQVFDKMNLSGSDVTSTNQTAAANSAQNTKQETKEAQNKKTTNEKQNKTVQDSLYTLIKWQSAVSLASGVISSFGENGKVAAEVLTELSSIGLLFTQGKEVLEGFTKDRSSGAGKALRLGGAGRDGAASLSSSLSIAGNFGRVANTAGVGVGGAIGGIAAGLAGPAAAIYATYKIIDMGNTIYKKYGETADRTADALGRLNDIQKTYTLNLTEEQKAKSESFVKRVGTFEAATAFDRAFNFQNLNPLDKTTQTKNALQSLGLEGSVNTGILSGLTQIVQPEAEREFTTERKKGNKQITQTKIIDRMVAEKINQIAEESKTNFTNSKELEDYRRNPKTAAFDIVSLINPQLEKIEKSKEYIDKVSELDKLVADKSIPREDAKMQLRDFIAQRISTGKIDFDKFFASLQKNFQENSKKVGVDNLVKSFIAESFLIPAETLKAQINTFGELQKVILSYTSAEENNLALKKELLTINAQEKANIETQLRLKQEERQTNEQLGNAAFEFVKNIQNTAITKLGTSLPENYSATRTAAMEKFAQNVYNPQTTDEQRLKFAQDEVKAIKSSVDASQEVSAEKQQYLNYLDHEVRQLEFSQKLTRSQQAARRDIILIENQRLAIATKDNFIETTIRESLTAKLSINQKLLDQDRQRLDIVRKISDIQYETKTLATPNQDPSVKERLDLERSLATSGPRQMEDYQIQRQSALLADRLNALNIAFQRGANANDVQKITEAQDYQSLEQALQTVLNKEAQSINDRVIKAGDAFFIKAQEAGRAVGEEIFKILNSVSESDIQTQIKIARGFESSNDYFDQIERSSAVTPAARIAASRVFGDKLPTDPRTESGLPASPATARNVLLGGTPVQNPKDLINAQAEQTIKQLIFAQEKRALDIKLQLTTAEIANAQKAIDLRKEERDWQQKLRDSAFEFYQTQLSPYQSEKAAAYRNIEEEKTRGLQENTDRMQETSLRNRQAGLNTLMSKGASSSEINSYLTGEKKGGDILKTIEDRNIDKMYGLEKDPFAEQVVEAAKEFKQIILGAGAAFVAGKKVKQNNFTNGSLITDDLGFSTKPESEKALSPPIDGAVSNLRNEELKASLNKAKLNTYRENLAAVSPEVERIKSIPGPVPISSEEQATLDYAEDLKKSIEDLTSALKEKAQQEKDKNTSNNNRLIFEAGQSPITDRSGQVTQVASNRTKTANERFAQEEQFGKGFRVGLRDIDDEITKFQAKLGKQIPTDFRNGLVDAMKALSDPNATTSLRERLLGVAASFLNKINDALMKNTADKITSGIGSGIGSMFNFASGGPIKGGSGIKDDVPAMLMGGEYVIKKNVVNKYGKDFFDQINSGKMKGFASGGLVGFQEANIKDTVVNAKNYIPFGQTRVGDLSFDESGKVIGLSSYTGKEENKADALAKAQTSYYEKNAQSGEGGFFIPGTYGQGAIMGQRDLLAYATQQTVGTQFDKISSGRDGASVNLAAGSRNLSLFGLRNQDNPMTADYLESKNKAKDLYFGGVEAQKQKFSIEEEARKRIEEYKAQMEKEKKAAEKAFRKSILTSIITSVAMAGLSKIGDSMASGWAATENASLASTGQSASFGDKFSGMFSGGMGADGMSYGGLSNIFNQRGSMDLSVIAGGGNAYQMNPLTKNYEWISNEKYNTMFPRGASYGSSPNVNWGTGVNGMKMYTPMRRAAGGYVAGNGMGDNVPAMLNGGEFVVSKQAAEKIGYGNLQNLNSSQKPTTDSSELISRLEGKLEEIFDKVSGVGTINISVSSDGKGKNQDSETNSNEEEKNRQMARKIKEVVMNVLKDEKRLGGMLR
jgi:TP901 family phage tail tape measure protein